VADTILSPTGLVQIEPGASDNTWGAKLNDNAEIINNLFAGLPDNAEGEFDAILTAAGTAPTGVTYGARKIQYAKAGRTVTISGRLTLTGKGTGGIGRVYISNLPYTAQIFAAADVARAQGFSIAAGLQIGGWIEAATLSFIAQGSSSVFDLNWADITNTFDVMISATYHRPV
jgi:hypothetical protein